MVCIALLLGTTLEVELIEESMLLETGLRLPDVGLRHLLWESLLWILEAFDREIFGGVRVHFRWEQSGRLELLEVHRYRLLLMLE